MIKEPGRKRPAVRPVRRRPQPHLFAPGASQLTTSRSQRGDDQRLSGWLRAERLRLARAAGEGRTGSRA